MLEVEEKKEEVGVDSRNDVSSIQDVVDRRRRDMEREIGKKRRLVLGLHNGMLKVLPPVLAFPKLL